jgi:succinate dehydrogenase / fumarate reductase iron-sulfur subunit
MDRNEKSAGGGKEKTAPSEVPAAGCAQAENPAPGPIRARAYRFDPSGDGTSRFQEYEVSCDAPVSVMALLAKIHEQDPSFACRTSMCFHGTCGSCWVRVNGKNVRGCMQVVRPGETLTIEPHSGYKALRDVVVDFASPAGAEAEEEVPDHEDR